MKAGSLFRRGSDDDGLKHRRVEHAGAKFELSLRRAALFRCHASNLFFPRIKSSGRLTNLTATGYVGAVTLRAYQVRAIESLRASYRSGKRAPCLVLPTGAGKTVVCAEVIRSAVAGGKRVLFLVHRVELIAQSVHKLELAGVTHVRVIQAASDLGDPLAPVVVASIPTLSGKTWVDRMPVADLVVFDECHHVAARTWAALALSYPKAWILGLTATPERADGKALGDVFDSIVVGSTVSELTELGHLVPLRCYAPRQELESQQMAISVATAYRELAEGARAVVFCGTVEHANLVRDELRASGVTAEVVHGAMRADLRSEVLSQFRAGIVRCVVNVYVLTEGWDDPGASVCILARRPAHAGTFLQMVGRVLRPSPGKTHATLIDLCGSVLEHGTPDAEREYCLDGKAIRVASRDAIWQCAACGCVLKSRPGAVCPNCGHDTSRDASGRPIEAPLVTGVGVVDVGSLKPTKPMRAIRITAKWPSKCRACGNGIRVGEEILWAQGTKPVHAGCSRK